MHHNSVDYVYLPGVGKYLRYGGRGDHKKFGTLGGPRDKSSTMTVGGVTMVLTYIVACHCPLQLSSNINV